MAPAEMPCQGIDLHLIRPGFDETEHVEKILAAEAGTILDRQLSRQCRDNLFSIFASRLGKDIAVNPDTNLPIHHHQFGVDALRYSNARRLHNLAQIASELSNPFQRGVDAG